MGAHVIDHVRRVESGGRPEAEAAGSLNGMPLALASRGGCLCARAAL
ncbi:MAG TPA: hypothetical protein VK459_14695 [Polyangiaceae bacterium]|nr:hypothetical protein [Polyangiaceae bacterium]